MKSLFYTRLGFSFLLLPVLLLVSCSGVKIYKTDSYPGFTLSSYKTFDFFLMTGDSAMQKESPQRVEWIKQEISKQLVARGLTQSVNPELLINIGIVVEDKVQTRQTNLATDAPHYYGQRNYKWESEEIPIDRYKEGTVTIDLVNRERNALVWQGLAQSVIVSKDEDSKKNIAKGAQKIVGLIP